MKKVTLGSDQRIGSGNKMKVDIAGFERSTQDMGYVWRSSMSAGTLVPFMNEVALPGDTWDIDLGCEVLTQPTIGPLFGSYKVQLDVFVMPMRLMVGPMYMNRQGMGLRMGEVTIPQMRLIGKTVNWNEPVDNQQINQSCVLKYLGIAGLGYDITGGEALVQRDFNAMPLLTYWEIYKYYYANTQEKEGVVIHRSVEGTNLIIEEAKGYTPTFPLGITINTNPAVFDPQIVPFVPNGTLELEIPGVTAQNFNVDDVMITFMPMPDGTTPTGPGPVKTNLFDAYFSDYEINEGTETVEFTNPKISSNGMYPTSLVFLISYTNSNPQLDVEPKLVRFPLENIDTMRGHLLASNGFGSQIQLSYDSPINVTPYSYVMEADNDEQVYATTFNQEGLGIKTYQSDIFNNWLNTEWIDGPGGINDITSVPTGDGAFSINQLIINKKMFDMLNKIGVSGGTYDAWQNAIYDTDRARETASPTYVGGLIKELIFQEVVSQSQAGEQPLGTLAGRGRLGSKHKGGQVKVKVTEPSIIMGIASITPRITYSQGNKWDASLKTIDNLHKPDLDQIGFQSLITDKMAWFNTIIDVVDPQFRTIGKQPAWIDYMTNVDRTYGTFADEREMMWMTLNRRYESEPSAEIMARNIDATTYIDPSKFNYIFADTRRDAQNFWVHIGVDAKARRKMSAKIMPSL